MTNHDSLIELCRSFVQIPSFSGQEAKMVEFIRRTMTEYGYHEIIVDQYGSIIGILQGSRPGKTILLDGHIDHVGVDDRELWQHDPFGAEVENGRIYGRGTSDMKGGVAAMITAAAQYVNDCVGDFAGTICVSCTVHEECFEGVAARSVTNLLEPDFVIIGEPTSGTVKIGQRGRAELVVETVGVSCHSASPQKGVNAVYSMTEVIRELRNSPRSAHPILGSSLLELTDIVSMPYPGTSIVPNLCRATYDCRVLPGETEETVLQLARDAYDRIKVRLPQFQARCRIAEGEADCWNGAKIWAKRFFPAWVVSPEEPLVHGALEGLRNAQIPFQVSHFDFCTNGSHFCGEARIPSIGYGPSQETLAHVRDEYIEITDLLQVCQGYQAILAQLTGSH